MATNKETIYIPLEDVESEHCALIVEKGLAQVKGVPTTGADPSDFFALVHTQKSPSFSAVTSHTSPGWALDRASKLDLVVPKGMIFLPFT